eukprot:scaffold857_cov152-Ochromonas_danica.AAC.20
MGWDGMVWDRVLFYLAPLLVIQIGQFHPDLQMSQRPSRSPNFQIWRSRLVSSVNSGTARSMH